MQSVAIKPGLNGRRASTLPARTAALLVLACGLTARGDAVAQTRPSGPLVSATTRVGGRSYSQWVVAWMRRRLGRHARHAAPSGRECITTDQRPPVWFLAGNDTAKTSLIRSCSVSAERSLLLGPCLDCSTVTYDLDVR